MGETQAAIFGFIASLICIYLFLGALDLAATILLPEWRQ